MLCDKYISNNYNKAGKYASYVVTCKYAIYIEILSIIRFFVRWLSLERLFVIIFIHMYFIVYLLDLNNKHIIFSSKY